MVFAVKKAFLKLGFNVKFSDDFLEQWVNLKIAGASPFIDSQPLPFFRRYETSDHLKSLFPLKGQGIFAPPRAYAQRASSYTPRNDSPPAWSKPAPQPIAAQAVSIDHSFAEAVKIAKSCENLQQLYEALQDFTGCPSLKTQFTKTVLYDGNPEADIMVIGEAPGEQENRIGKPFVGPAGQLLDKMLASIGLNRHAGQKQNSVFITNVVYWQPLANRKPVASETSICLPFVHRVIELVRPKLIMLAGGTAVSALWNEQTGITRIRGKWKDIVTENTVTPSLATYHPSYLLRTPLAKKAAWFDLLSLQERLRSL